MADKHLRVIQRVLAWARGVTKQQDEQDSITAHETMKAATIDMDLRNRGLWPEATEKVLYMYQQWTRHWPKRVSATMIQTSAGASGVQY
jgi:hypothetical protein